MVGEKRGDKDAMSGWNVAPEKTLSTPKNGIGWEIVQLFPAPLEPSSPSLPA